MTTTATNIGSEACPYGSGMHPYLTVGTQTVDTVVLRAPGQTVLHADERGVPVSTAPVEGTEFDLRRPKSIGARKLDNAFTDLERGDDGLARVELRRPDDETALSFWLDETYPVPAVVHGRSAPERQPSQPRRRADDLSGERVPQPREPPRARTRRVDHRKLGTQLSALTIRNDPQPHCTMRSDTPPSALDDANLAS